MSLSIYTDGACSGNHTMSGPRRAGIGLVMVDDDQVVWDHGEDITDKIGPDITNNRAELYAICMALETFLNEVQGYDSLTIFTDSKYSVDTFNEWLPKWKEARKEYKNKDLIDRADELLTESRKQFQVRLEHVRGHASNKYNNMADKLAVQASTK